MRVPQPTIRFQRYCLPGLALGLVWLSSSQVSAWRGFRDLMETRVISEIPACLPSPDLPALQRLDTVRRLPDETRSRLHRLLNEALTHLEVQPGYRTPFKKRAWEQLSNELTQRAQGLVARGPSGRPRRHHQVRQGSSLDGGSPSAGEQRRGYIRLTLGITAERFNVSGTALQRLGEGLARTHDELRTELERRGSELAKLGVRGYSVMAEAQHQVLDAHTQISIRRDHRIRFITITRYEHRDHLFRGIAHLDLPTTPPSSS